MGRRRLRLLAADEEEEGPHLQTLTLTGPAPQPAQPKPPPADAPLDISDDDDYADVPDAFSDPSPPPPPEPPSAAVRTPHRVDATAGGRAGVDAEDLPSGPVGGFLRGLGLRPRREWLESCLAGLSGSHGGFDGLDDAAMAKLCFEQFLFSDMNVSGGGVLPRNVCGMHGVALEGPFVLQVDEIVNISSPLRDRYHDAPAGFKRCLKLSLTDGIQHVYGMEYRPISQLKVLAPAGLKIAIRNVHVQRGLLMLVPEAVEVLGGLDEGLEAARERLVLEVNKPPRGKRKQPIISVSKRASLAAWPSSITGDVGHSNLAVPYGDIPHMIPQVNFTESRSDSRVDIIDEVAADLRTGENNLEQSSAVHTRRTVEQVHASCRRGNVEVVSDPHAGRSIIEDLAIQQVGQSEDFPTPCTRSSNMEQQAVQDTLGSTPTQSGVHQSGECNAVESNVTHNVVDSEQHVSSNDGPVLVDNDMADKVEHPLILNGVREVPFTYLACLLAKWAAKEGSLSSIQGKIKCFLTGVKGFLFKQRNTYELRVYVDDGSLISEVLVDHHVVEKGIGYSPWEVTAALSSSDKKISSNMREVMKRFQLFLTNFEGTMLVEISQDQTVPVALEMNQGYSTSDAWPLLIRLKTFTASLVPRQQDFDIIDVSP